MTIVSMNKHDRELIDGNNSWVVINKFVYEAEDGKIDTMSEPYDLSCVFVGDVSEKEIAQFLERCGFPWVASFN